MAHQISVDMKRDAEIAAVATDEAIEKGRAVPMTRSFRYLNRLTPITASGRATEKGVRHVALEVLWPWFKLSLQPANSLGEKDDDDSTSPIYAALKKMQGTAENKPDYTFAIRPSFRHHHELERRSVIDLVAALIDQNHHKVDLVNPDKIILIEIFRYTCGMSVVDGDWNSLRKYNLSELSNLQLKNKEPQDLAKVTGTITTTREGGDTVTIGPTEGEK
ncbi:hypothetical protein HMPREF1624_01078 [Sporothrix schenckii ATCC 58251]|uniref:THUMP domain-containing protein n=2 Tax=Sporothrix schenckii TaxID=29908 RepID=U7Q7R0_SPOS1|nr:hypothetical protein HMPREF1624_01078 [Sporothrix schenckii ATCC 58251]